MKRSEKLFMLINKIDENIISEAKGEPQKPNRITIEKRAFPIKETLAFAACFAVLAVGIFAIMKFRINSPEPVDSNAGNSDVSAVVTHNDEELREILRELAANAIELDGMFTESGSGTGTSYRLKINDTDYRGEYSPVSDQDRTEPNGLFAMPQSRDEIEALLLTTFTRRAVEYYMYDVGTGKLAADYNGSTVITDDDPRTGQKKFIEIDGQLYRGTSESQYKWYCDPETAHVISKTDKTIRFSYSGNDDWDEDVGTIIFENGGWKLDYFHDSGFIPELPTEFTEDDIELQGILSRLTPADKIAKWFSCPEGDYETQTFAFAETGYLRSVRFAKFPTGAFTDEDNYPHSLNELEQLMLKYFTQDAVDSFMEQADHAEFQNVPNTSDGVYSVVTTKSINSDMDTPSVLEIDGELYHATYVKGSGEVALLNTAKVTEKTDSSIKYSLIHTMNGSYYNIDGLIEYERGGWRRDPFYKPEDPEADNTDNKELQDILSGMLDEARDIDGIFYKMSAHGEEYGFKYITSNGVPNDYYLVTSGLRTEPNGLFAFPQNRGETEELLSKYFSERAVKTYMRQFSTGSMTQNSDGTYAVETDNGDLTAFIEINGKLFYRPWDSTRELDFDLATAKIISKTDKTIKFEFTPAADWLDGEGALVFENGSWKLNYFGWNGFISEYPTEFTSEDEELQKILEELAPNREMTDWFSATGEYSDAYHFEFPELGKLDYVTFYSKLPTGKIPGFNEQYPRSYNELKTLMLKYFTGETVDYLMERVCRGTKTEISNEEYPYCKGSYSVTTDQQTTDSTPRIIEIDGEMYYSVFEKSGSGRPVYDTAKVISRTDDSIEFSYLGSEMGGYFENCDIIKFERGGWRMAYVESHYQSIYRINTNILSDLGLTYDQLVEKRGELGANTYKGVWFENGIGIYAWKSENGESFWVDNDHTNPGGLPNAGGCNVIAGLKSSDLLTNFKSPMRFDELCEQYGFVLVSEEWSPGLDGYAARFTHPSYDNVTFVADTGETTGGIDYNTVWWISLDVDCKNAAPVI